MYSLKTRVGNWFEDILLKEEKKKDFLKKRERNELVYQKHYQLRSKFLREVPISKKEDFVKFGRTYQIYNRSIPQNDNKKKGIFIAATVFNDDIVKTTKIVDGCPIRCALESPSVVRNTFTIQSADCRERDNQNLCYGSEFVLQLANPEDEVLYMRSEIPLIDGKYGPYGHYLLSLSNILDRFCKFKALHCRKREQVITEGKPIEPGAEVLIVHVMSGQCISAENRKWHESLLGMECDISVHTYYNVQYLEARDCVWEFICQDIHK